VNVIERLPYLPVSGDYLAELLFCYLFWRCWIAARSVPITLQPTLPHVCTLRSLIVVIPLPYCQFFTRSRCLPAPCDCVALRCATFAVVCTDTRCVTLFQPALDTLYLVLPAFRYGALERCCLQFYSACVTVVTYLTRCPARFTGAGDLPDFVTV